MRIIKRKDHSFPLFVDDYGVHEASENLKDYPNISYEFEDGKFARMIIEGGY